MYDPPFPPQHSAHARLGAHNREARHKLARWLAYKFGKTGVAVVTDRCFVVAWVNPLGQIKFAVPPFERLERHTCTNNPSWKECECRRWFDPESGGPWGRRKHLSTTRCASSIRRRHDAGARWISRTRS